MTKRRKIAIVSTYSKGATVNRVISIINVLSDYEVHVIGPIKKMQYLKSKSLYNKDIIVHYISAPKKNYNSFFLRYLVELKYSWKCSKITNSLECDFEFVTIPYVSLSVTSIFYKNGALKILDIRDLVWEYLSDKTLTSKLLKRVFKFFHLFFVKRHDLITLTNNTELRQLTNDLPQIKKEIISNGISEYQFYKIQEFKKALYTKPNQVINITYIGNVGIAQNLFSFIVEIKKFKKIELTIVGDGNDMSRLTSFVDENNIKNVKFTGRVSPDEVFHFYKSCDFLWAKLDPSYASAVPSKLYEYLATGKPIIYSGKGAALELLSRFDNIYYLDDYPAKINSLLKKITFKNELTSRSNENIELIRKEYIRENINLKLLTLIQ